MEKLLIIGCGSQARYVIDIVCFDKNYEIVGMVDLQSGKKVGSKINGVEVICKLKELGKHFAPENLKVIVAHGEIMRKSRAVKFLEANGFSFGNTISSKAVISPYAQIGKGCIINPNVVTMPNAAIGNHVIVHSQTVIEHDNEIGDFCNIGPGISFGGYVKIGQKTSVYTGATVIPKIRIGNNAIVAAGAVVIKDVKDNEVVAGVPAKPIGMNAV